MFVYDLSEKDDFFGSLLQVHLGFGDNLFDGEISLQSSRERDDTVGAELITSGGNRDICGGSMMAIHRSIDPLREDFFVFIDHFGVAGNFVSEFGQDKW